MDRDKLFSSFFGFIVLVDRCKQVKDFALNVVSNLRFGIAVIRKIAHCAADCFPFCFSKKFGDRAKIGGCFVHTGSMADPVGFGSSWGYKTQEENLKVACANLDTGFILFT